MRISLLRTSRVKALVALAIAALSVISLYGYLKSLEDRTAKNGPLQHIVIAAVDIPQGKQIQADWLEYRPMPSKYLLPTMITDTGGLKGCLTLHEVKRGEPLLESDLADTSDSGSIALRLPQGYRGFPLPLKNTPLPVSSLKPGDRVDVLAASDEKGSTTILEAVILLDIVESLPDQEGIGPAQYVSSDSSGYAILQLKPSEAERLAEVIKGNFSSIILTICPSSMD